MGSDAANAARLATCSALLTRVLLPAVARSSAQLTAYLDLDQPIHLKGSQCGSDPHRGHPSLPPQPPPDLQGRGDGGDLAGVRCRPVMSGALRLSTSNARQGFGISSSLSHRALMLRLRDGDGLWGGQRQAGNACLRQEPGWQRGRGRGRGGQLG